MPEISLGEYAILTNLVCEKARVGSQGKSNISFAKTFVDRHTHTIAMPIKGLLMG
jgi:hypothetical protein